MKKLFWGLLVTGWAFVHAPRAQALSFTPHENPLINWLQAEALAKLPPLLLQKLKDTTLQIRLEVTSDTEIASWRTGTNIISINQRITRFNKSDLLQRPASAWLPAPVQGPLLTHHRRLYDLILGALLHEVVHVYDWQNFAHEEYRHRRKICVESAAIGMPIKEGECWAILNLQRSLSDSPEFLQLAGFPQRGFILTDHHALNSKWQRSPDPYEFKSPEEALGVNMEFFLLDPEYRCRRPLLYDYFSDYFHFQPFAIPKCKTASHVFIQSATPSQFSDQWEELKIDRLYQVQYLWAGPGKETMSRYGHSMLRLVLCAPFRTKVGPECLKDTFAHRILSFRAAVDDLDINSLKGLEGDYPSYLYILKASDVILEYTRTEGRELYSLPLRLSRQEMQRVLSAALEAHWSYRGRYRFLANNCAHETWNLLQSALVYRSGISDKTTLRPDELYEMLIKIGLASPKYSITNEKTIPSILKLKSQNDLFAKNFEVLQRLGVVTSPPTGPLTSSERFLEQSSKARRQMAVTLLKKPDTPERRRALYAFLNLSEYQLEKMISQWLKQYLIPFTNHYRDNRLLPVDATEFRGLLQKMMNSQQLIPLRDHYGIPTTTEIEALPTDLLEARFLKLKALSESLLTAFRNYLPAAEKQQWQDEEEIVINLRRGLPLFSK